MMERGSSKDAQKSFPTPKAFFIQVNQKSLSTTHPLPFPENLVKPLTAYKSLQNLFHNCSFKEELRSVINSCLCVVDFESEKLPIVNYCTFTQWKGILVFKSVVCSNEVKS